MKQKYSLVLLIIICTINAGAQIINIPDANFKNALVNTNCAYLISATETTDVDANNNGEIELSEAQDVGYLTLGNNNIANLTGLEHFTNLISLSIFRNPITSINVSTFNQLVQLSVNETLLTEINLCGTQVKWLWCYDNANLQSLYLKNNVVSPDLAGSARLIPPPLHNFEFYNTPLLSYICYDEGEFPAIDYALRGNTAGVTLTTSCEANCSLSAETPQLGEFILYPNPSLGIVSIEVEDGQSIKKISVDNVLGQKVMVVENAASIDLSQLTKGTYFVTVETNQGKATQKVIKL